MDIVIAIAGLAVLLVGGDLLVRGAVALSLKLGVPQMIVGLTVVAFGTSIPEMLIGIQAALDGFPGIALGNVVGSNIANILLVLGVPAIISTVPLSNGHSMRNYFQMIGASVLLIVLCALGPLYIWHAVALLGLFALMLADMARSGRKQTTEAAEIPESTAGMPVWRMVGYLIAGLVFLPVGAKLLIEGAVGIAVDLGLSDAVIGLTIVAVGTSLPELATTVMAAIKRHGEVALGNVLGSNLFNILSILGVTSLFGPIVVAPEFLTRDLWVMLACGLLLGPLIYAGKTLGRAWGLAFILLYCGYTFLLFQQH